MPTIHLHNVRVAQLSIARRICSGILIAALTVWVCTAPNLRAQTDDFSDGNDTANPTWIHNSGYVLSTGQSWTVEGGAYRLQAPNNGLQGYGYIGSFVGSAYTDVSVSADVVNFSSLGGAFGVGARMNSTDAFGNLNGYGYGYEPYASGGLGEVVLYRIENGVNIVDLGAQQVTLDPAKDYKFVLEVTGTSLHGQVFEIGGGMVAERTAVDATYASGLSGVFGYGRNITGPPPINLLTDFSVDNFAAAVVPEPGATVLAGLGCAALLALRRRQPKQS